MESLINHNMWLKRFFRQVAQFVHEPTDEAASTLRKTINEYQAIVHQEKYSSRDPHEIVMNFR